MKLQIGQDAPHFSAQDQVGKPHSLNDYRGQYLLLYFYPKDDTPGCTTEACSFRDGYSELLPFLQIIGVSADSRESHEKFAKKYKLPFPLLADEKKNILKSYGVNGVFFSDRTSFLIDPNGKIAKIYDKVVPEKHTQEVLADMRSFSR
jgi:peroxiredoxin Q/BCP